MDTFAQTQMKKIVSFPEAKDKRLALAAKLFSSGHAQDAEKELIQLIDEGVDEASSLLGELYELQGQKGEISDFQKAKFYYEKAMESCGSQAGVLGLARLYFYGKGMEVNYQKAFDLYSLAIKEETGSLSEGFASWMLGRMYMDGLGTANDLKKARYYFRKAWASGHVPGLSFWANLEWKLGNYQKSIVLRLLSIIFIATLTIKDRRHPRLRVV